MSGDSDIAPRERLLALKARLEQAVGTASSADESITPDNAIGRLTRMEAIQAQSISNAGRERSRKRLRQVEIALNRVEDGTYGTCVRCAAGIDQGRLDVLPETRLCTKCAARL